MKTFSENINVKNIKKFSELNFFRNLCYLRKEIYEHIISREETDYFQIDKFQKEFLRNNSEFVSKLMNIVIKELKDLGWNCKLGFGDTALFIYSTDKTPVTYWED
jgi:hypothetical protein